MGRHKYWVLGSVSAVLLFLGAFIFSNPTVAEATLVVSEGEATVEYGTTRLLVVPARAQRTVPAGETLALSEGDTIQLNAGAKAQLRLLNGSTVDLSEGALLHVTELINSQETFRVRLYLFTGRTVNRIEHLLDVDDAFVISTPSSTTSVRGTVFSVEVLTEDSTEVTVDEGKVFVSTEDAGVEVPAGFKLRVEIGQPLGLPEPKPTWEPPLVTEVQTETRSGKPAPEILSPCVADPAACETPDEPAEPAASPTPVAPVVREPVTRSSTQQRAAPTPTTQPTARPSRTATPVPPTATPYPTATAKPTLTPTVIPPTSTPVPTLEPTSPPPPPPTNPPPPPPTDPPAPPTQAPTPTDRPSADVTEPSTPSPEPTSDGISGNCIGGDCDPPDDSGESGLPEHVCEGPAGESNPNCPPS